MNLGVIDIGGTTIKCACWVDHHLIERQKYPTPSNLTEFMKVLKEYITLFKTIHNFQGVAISSPGAVNKKTGIIEGASAVSYIHNFKIIPVFEELFELPVSIENDANCAALAELNAGAGKDCKNLVFLVIGTGVGGTIVIDRNIYHGSHLYGGEFGFQLVKNNSTLSQMGSPVNLARRYNEKTGEKMTGKDVFEQALAGNQLAKKYVDEMIDCIATAIFNIQHSIDPEKIIIGGAISQNKKFILMIKQRLSEICQKIPIATLMSNVEACHFTGDANLRGAVVDFEKSKF